MREGTCAGSQELFPDSNPLHLFADPTSRSSAILRDNDDVISSQGVKLSRFVRAVPGADRDVTVPVPDDVFNINGLNTRRAEPRNTPTVINAAFNRDAFWDGRAETIFNGVSIFGVRDQNARVLKAGEDSLTLVKIRIDHAALASQAQIPSAELLTQPMFTIANPAIAIGERTSTRSFKTPLLPNIELTARYFHNGGQGTLLQLVNFCNRGGDFREHNAQFIISRSAN